MIKVLNRGFDLFFDDRVKHGFEKIIVYLAIAGFLIHLALIYLHNWAELDFFQYNPELLTDPISAIYTPFSFILIYEVYLLVYNLPRSFTTSIVTQYEIISIIIIRRIFKDISKWEMHGFSDRTDNILLIGDMVGILLIFALIYWFNILRKNRPDLPQKADISKFIDIKKAISALLVPILLAMAIYSLVDWLYEIQRFRVGDLKELSDINKIFYNEFFNVLILVDVLILMISLLYTERYSQLIRNSGFVISTILIRLSFAATGIKSIILILSGVLFGVLILVIYNQIGKSALTLDEEQQTSDMRR